MEVTHDGKAAAPFTSKIDGDGHYLRFPGVTFIAFLDGRLDSKWKIFENFFNHQLTNLKRYYSLLPPSSYHMTVKNHEVAEGFRGSTFFFLGAVLLCWTFTFRRYNSIAIGDWMEHVILRHSQLEAMKQACVKAHLRPRALVSAFTRRTILRVELQPELMEYVEVRFSMRSEFAISFSSEFHRRSDLFFSCRHSPRS